MIFLEHSFFCNLSMFNRVEGVLFIECDGGRHGQNCSNTCGFCSQKEQCHFITGNCAHGCENGYKGDRCKQSNLILLIAITL